MLRRMVVAACLLAGLAACGGDGGGGNNGFLEPDGGTGTDDISVTPDGGEVPPGCTGHSACQAELSDELRACEEARCADDGTCVVVVAADDASCDDSAPCTENDVCSAGECAGVPRSCDDDNPCTTDVCDPKEVDSPCVYTVIEGACDDDDFCTVDDACIEGQCVGTIEDCTAHDGECSVGQCDPADGSCSTVVLEDGTSCDDGVPCTSGDQCAAGLCAGTATECSDVDSECAAGYCDPETGECVGLLINEGGSCDDGDACTYLDTCLEGACAGTAMDCSAEDGECTVGGCEDGECVAQPMPMGTACQDGDACTADDICAGGGCQPGELVVCDDGVVCNGLESCDGETGECTLGETVECDDGNPCNGVESCDEDSAGCVSGAPVICDDADPCNGFESCESTTGECVPGTPIDCDDGNHCDGVETCEVGTGACLPGAPVVCDDDDACNGVEACDGDTGECLLGEAVPCDDGLPCNGLETCNPADGSCGPGEPVVCDDDDACNGLEACDVETGACYSGAAPDCDDGDLCNGIEGCEPGTGECLPGEPPACDDGDACNGLETCDDATGGCVLGEMVLCDDGLPCNGLESCDPDSGDCLVGETLLCDDGLPCNGLETCVDEHGGCLEGEPVVCEDDDPCDGVTACVVNTGECVEGPPPLCSDGDPCNGEETCVAESGGCVTGDAPDCDDGLLCTDDACIEGQGCQHTLNPTCQCATIADCAPFQTEGLCDGSLDCYGDVCMVDPTTIVPCDTLGDGPCDNTGCDLETGVCETLPDTGSVCGDGDLCTVQDTCVEGVCTGVPRDCSYQDEPCTVGQCQPADGECVPIVSGDGDLCSDGNPCTQDETCTAGACGGGSGVDCSGLDSACALGECLLSFGGCVGTPINEGNGCDDSDACTETDLCVLGICSGEAKDCDIEAEDCAVGGCDSGTGECVVVPVDEADECDDADACTTQDACVEGVCTGATVDCVGDAAACQTASCDAVAGCTFTSVSDGEPCDDGDGCTTDTTCASGLCAGQPIDCSVELIGPCEVAACDPAWGSCVVSQVADDTPCDDGDPCTTGELCLGGTCEGDPVECPGSTESCAVHACDPGTGGCIATSVGDGEGCDDGNPCTDGDLCQAGGCHGQEIDCGGGTPCATASCDPESSGCVLSTYDDGTPCDDANQCTLQDACVAGQCVGDDVACESEELCTLLSCDAGTGGCTVTTPLADGSLCGENSSCDGAGACQGGSCQTGAPVQCPEPSDPCLVAYCDDVAGGCIEGPAVDGAGCDDGDSCTAGDTCSAGVCSGQAIPDCGAVPVLCEASGATGTYGHCEIHVARRCQNVPATGTLQFYFSWDPGDVQVVYFTDSAQDPSLTPPFTDPLYQTYPSYEGSFAAPGYYPTCDAHPQLPDFCLSYTHQYNTGPGDSSANWPGNMTIFVYTDGVPVPIVDGVLGANGALSGDTLVFHLHYRLEADVSPEAAVPIHLTEIVANDLDTVPFAATFEDGVIVLDYDQTGCP